MKNRLIFARDNFKEGNKLSMPGKEKLIKFIRWLINYDVKAYVQRTFLAQFTPPVLLTSEIKHLGKTKSLFNCYQKSSRMLEKRFKNSMAICFCK